MIRNQTLRPLGESSLQFHMRAVPSARRRFSASVQLPWAAVIRASNFNVDEASGWRSLAVFRLASASVRLPDLRLCYSQLSPNSPLLRVALCRVLQAILPAASYRVACLRPEPSVALLCLDRSCATKALTHGIDPS